MFIMVVVFDAFKKAMKKGFHFGYIISGVAIFSSLWYFYVSQGTIKDMIFYGCIVTAAIIDIIRTRLLHKSSNVAVVLGVACWYPKLRAALPSLLGATVVPWLRRCGLRHVLHFPWSTYIVQLPPTVNQIRARTTEDGRVYLSLCPADI